jgi:hypothetical protein
MGAASSKAWSDGAKSYFLKVSPRGQGLSPGKRTKVASSMFLRLEYLALKFAPGSSLSVYAGALTSVR